MVAESRLLHFLQKFMQLRPISGDGFFGDFSDQVDDIHAEAADPFGDPAVHHRVDFLAHLLVLPVQIRLFFAEKVQVVLSARRIPFPGRTGEGGAQSVGHAAVRGRISPDVIVAVRIVFAFFGFNEPGVLIRSVVYHQIHHHFDIAFVGFRDEMLHLLHRAEFVKNGFVIGNVIPVVVVRRLVDRRKPDGPDPQILQIIQFFGHTGDIANTVAVAVPEAPRIDLINDNLLPPMFFHAATSSLIYSK
ncbi:hypothetical protein SDC9_108651 [bioreactor metagenome]|uniref:Uncharacterized protein n=1 Tax=bioreactor metagenome TaxID=1076179 RepID=A0A645BAV9_9ZZZZ